MFREPPCVRGFFYRFPSRKGLANSVPDSFPESSSCDFGGVACLSWVRPFVTFSHCQAFLVVFVTLNRIFTLAATLVTVSHWLVSTFCLGLPTVFHIAKPLSKISSHCQTSCCCFCEFVPKQPSRNHNSFLMFKFLFCLSKLSAPKSQRFLRFAIAMPIADPRNRMISEKKDTHDALRFKGAMESR